MTACALVPVEEEEVDALFAMFDTYWTELEGYEPVAAEIMAAADRRAEMVEDAEDQEWLWIERNGARAGFMLLQTRYDTPLLGLRTQEVIDLYVAPEHRRQGLARAAVEALLAREREHGSSLVEADVLRDNAPALAFWESLGFAVRAYRTARRP